MIVHLSDLLREPLFRLPPLSESRGLSHTITNQNGIFKQFALNEGQPTGPVTLAPSFSETATGIVGNHFNEFVWTNGTSGTDPLNITREGKSEIVDVFVSVVPEKQILKGSVQKVSANSQHDMKLVFQPTLGGVSVPLVDLADALEINSFNWAQKVTHVPNGWTANVYSSTWDGSGRPTSLTPIQTNIGTGFIDHIVQDIPATEKTYVFVRDDPAPGGGQNLVWWRQNLVDDKEPYWNLEATGVSDTESATFLDTPKQPLGSLNLSDSQDYFGFETRLIGVRTDGSIRDLAAEFPNAGLKWTWKSNTMHDGSPQQLPVAGNVYGAVGSGAFPQASSDPVPPATSGGLFDLESDFVSAVAGDFDNDGDVDGRDFLVWQRAPNVGNLADWQNSYGSGLLASATAVPEPSSLLLSIAMVSLVATVRLKYSCRSSTVCGSPVETGKV